VFSSPPHLRFGADEAYAWVVGPAGGVVQLMAAGKGTRELAQWVVGPALQAMFDAYPEQETFIIVLDLSAMTSRDPAARAVMMDKARELGRRVERSFIVPPVKTNPVYRTTLHAAAALLTGFGIHIEFVSSAADVVKRMRLEPVVLRRKLQS
jgi:hypothetical protein